MPGLRARRLFLWAVRLLLFPTGYLALGLADGGTTFGSWYTPGSQQLPGSCNFLTAAVGAPAMAMGQPVCCSGRKPGRFCALGGSWWASGPFVALHGAFS